VSGASHPFRLKTPEKGGIKLRLRESSLAAIVAALYAALVVVLLPISFGPIQLRVADCLIPLSAIIGFPGVIGVTLGAIIANMYGFVHPIDIIFGSVANLLASWLILKFRKSLFISCTVASFIIGGIVGSYLWLFFPPPSILGLPLPIWLAMIVSIILSSFITVTGIGYPLVRTLRKAGLPGILETRGFQLPNEEELK
jgi:hypothetical protein